MVHSDSISFAILVVFFTIVLKNVIKKKIVTCSAKPDDYFNK